MEKLEHHTVTSGKVDRGHALAPFEAISFNNRTGEYLRTRHYTEARALARLRGNPRHSERKLIDHREKKDERGVVLPARVVVL